ncbi:hypothetical protein P1X15_26340 [Runella sp. MFBS21]|uniref:hypothetical protein n=1 Tax=Runella sp. MFBS21 TaxID=3034018 RepID=UPI0023F72F15|nr:hypothetical protein [Runella sp. MFBS21]MDF7821170.1 hypothetical protein [Runella sp. MFBS21]
MSKKILRLLFSFDFLLIKREKPAGSHRRYQKSIKIKQATKAKKVPLQRRKGHKNKKSPDFSELPSGPDGTRSETSHRRNSIRDRHILKQYKTKKPRFL